jgi:hypothetical protein
MFSCILHELTLPSNPQGKEWNGMERKENAWHGKARHGKAQHGKESKCKA